MSRIFISHAAADKPLVDPFVTTVIQLGCEVPKEAIFYSSGEDTGVPSGYTLNDYIRSQMETVSLVVAIISPSFQTRPYCVAELGAAWSRVGKLFPIAVPGLERTDLQGVLTGMIVRYLSDSAALDELHDQTCKLLGTSPGAKTWGRHKNQWLAHVDHYVRQLPKLRIITKEDYDRMLADLEGTRDALREAEATIREQETQIDRLATVKTAEDVTEILLPKDERKQFDALVGHALDALKEMPFFAREAMWFWLDGRDMPWPTSRDSEFDAALDAGWLREGRDETGVAPNDDFDEVRIAARAVARLDKFFSNDEISERFVNWFRTEYHASPDPMPRALGI